MDPRDDRLPLDRNVERVDRIDVLAVTGAVLLAATGAISLLAAQHGIHDGRLALIGGSAVALAAALWMRRLLTPLLGDVRTALAAAVVVAGALLVFLPGSFYTYADKDPGVYVLHGISIADTGDVAIVDEFAAEGDGLTGLTFSGHGARFPGFWFENPGDASLVHPQFFHFLPALFATAYDLGGLRALLHLNSFIAAFGVMCAFLAVRRIIDTRAAWIAAALLSTNMIQVFQAKYPTTEMLVQSLVFAAILAAVIAIDARRPELAAVAGFLLSVTWLVRPDGFVLLLPALAVAGLLWGLRRNPRASAAALVGMLAPLPAIVYQAHFRNDRYASTTEVPSLGLLLAALALLGIGMLVLRSTPLGASVGSRLARHTTDPDLRERWSRAMIGLAVLVAAFFMTRPWLLGEHHAYFGRSYDEINLYRLALFVSPVAMALAAIALVVIVRSWSWRCWLLVASGLRTLPVYLANARVSPRLMWWTRRYAPTVVPVLLVMAAIGVAWLLAHEGRRRSLARALGAIGLTAILVIQITQIAALHTHREMTGAHDLTARVVDLTAGTNPAIIWAEPRKNDIYDPSRNLSAVAWIMHDRPGLVLRGTVDQERFDDLGDRYVDRSLFYVSRYQEIPEGVDSGGFVYVGTAEGSVRFWDEGTRLRPDHARTFSYALDVWWIEGTAPPTPR